MKNKTETNDNCRRYEMLIDDYLNDNINDNDYLDFYRHMLYCPACKEELATRYFVKVGLDETEEPEDMNLPKNLDKMLNDNFIRIVNKRSRRFGLTILGIGFIIFIILFILF